MNLRKDVLMGLILFMSFTVQIKAQDLYDQEQLLEHMKRLSSDDFEGRLTGEKGNKKGRDYIINNFKEYKVQPFYADFEQSFNFKEGKTDYQGNNVIGVIKGASQPEKFIVISAHHDHVGVQDGVIYNGADDNASGAAALIAFAEFLSKNPPEYSVILAAFDAEELGIHGSSFFIKEIKDKMVVLNINMDMISRSSKDELYMVGSRYSNRLTELLKDFKSPTSSKLLIGHDGSDDKEDWTYTSDHSVFHEAGIPFLYFGNEDHEAYHQPDDDFENITPEFYKNSVTIILSIFELIDDKGL